MYAEMLYFDRRLTSMASTLKACQGEAFTNYCWLAYVFLEKIGVPYEEIVSLRQKVRRTKRCRMREVL